MRVGLLGELAVVDDCGVDVPIPGAKLRALLAVLALHVERVVPAEQLVDALWGDAPPEGVRNSLQGLVSKLRRALGSGDLVTMRGGGYVLDLPPDAIDAHRFEQQVAEARAAAASGDLERALRLLTEAEALWRGDALSDFPYEDFATGPIARLTEQRLTSLEERLDLELRLGEHQAAVVELEGLVGAHPLRERLRGLLMLALYRSGRQADALRAFQDGRHLLAEELGLEPGPELRQLESAILSQDPELDGQPVARAVTDTTGARSVIPEALTSLVGRDVELADLVEVLADGRLVTLVGPGGVGKTRLALEVARRASGSLPMGGCLVELAPVGDPDGVRPAIAAALGLTDHHRLAEMIGDQGLLLLLDNCEHVITAAAEVAEDLLRRCPGLKIVATSREGLRVGGEVIWPVPPLGATDAVELFLARGQAAGATLDQSEDTRTSIGEICARLDGLPLAIELAAARTRAFPIQQLSTRLSDRFRVLTGGSRTALPRQQTLRAVVDWSYDLLFEDEQRAFERLAVFPGGCDLATAEAVCAGDDLLADDIPDLIQALVDKSLVLAVPTAGAVRFTQLQTLAQYGREKLAERGEAEAFRNAMARHFANLCGQSAVAFTGDGQRAWLAAVERERDNLRAALEWAVSSEDAETAVTIAGGMAWPHWLGATIPEGRRWLDEALACGGKVSDTTRALGLTGRGLLDFLAGAPERADADLEEALAIFRHHGDRTSMALAWSFYAEIADVRGDLEEALRRRHEVFTFYDGEADDDFKRASRSWSRGKLGVLHGDLAEAEVHYRAAADGFAKIDRPVMRSMALGMVADFDELAGDHAAAVERLEEAIATNDELGLRGFVGSLLVRLGWALLHTAERDRAYAAYVRALEDARRVRNVPVLFLAHAGTATWHLLEGHDEQAERAARQALALHLAGAPRRFRNRIDRQRDELEGAAACCTVLAAVAAGSGEPAGAARLLGHAARLQAESGSEVPPFLQAELDEATERAQAVLGAAAFDAEVAAGRTGDLAADLGIRA
jgi:predicted ATPase/DNA-binding SARP family transcriptional activator